jgi:N,N'-diacetylchitobiose transport system substrate-binding protein
VAQVDAQAANWEPIVKAANAVQREHPGVAVNVQCSDLGEPPPEVRRDAGRGNAPDVIEMGNTEMTKYMAAGAFQDITSDRGSFANSGTWLEGLAAAGRYGGKLYGVPYYAGSRVVTYRTDLFKKAGIKVPTSLAEFTAAARKLGRQQGDRAFSPVYIAGTDWYVAMSFVYDNGGAIARQVSGKWGHVGRRGDRRADGIPELFLAATAARRRTRQPNPYASTPNAGR